MALTYIYANLDDVYYDIILVYDGSTNYSSNQGLNGFTPSKNASMELVSKLRIGDRVGWVNGTTSSFNEVLGTDFNQKLSKLNSDLLPNHQEILRTEF